MPLKGQGERAVLYISFSERLAIETCQASAVVCNSDPTRMLVAKGRRCWFQRCRAEDLSIHRF